MIRSTDDVLQWFAKELTQQYGGIDLLRPLEVRDLVDNVPNAKELLKRCVSLKLLTIVSKGDPPSYGLTNPGMARIEELDRAQALEDELPRLERWLRRKTKVWDLTVSTLLQGVTLAIAVAGLIMAILK
jgi:hypothetical protein